MTRLSIGPKSPHMSSPQALSLDLEIFGIDEPPHLPSLTGRVLAESRVTSDAAGSPIAKFFIPRKLPSYTH
jgi:hypothetical protein